MSPAELSSPRQPGCSHTSFRNCTRTSCWNWCRRLAGAAGKRLMRFHQAGGAGRWSCSSGSFQRESRESVWRLPTHCDITSEREKVNCHPQGMSVPMLGTASSSGRCSPWVSSRDPGSHVLHECSRAAMAQSCCDSCPLPAAPSAGDCSPQPPVPLLQTCNSYRPAMASCCTVHRVSGPLSATCMRGAFFCLLHCSGCSALFWRQ